MNTRTIIVVTAFLGFLTASTAFAFQYLKPQPSETLVSPLSYTPRDVSDEAPPDVLAAAVQEEVPTPPISPSVSPSLTPKKSNTPTLTLSPTPTPDPTVVDACRSAIASSSTVGYFLGNACYKKAYDEYMEKKKQSNSSSFNFLGNVAVYADELEGRLKTIGDSREVFDLLLQQCVNNGIESYRRCSTSLKDDSNRLKQEVLNKYSGDLENCLSRVAVGNEEEIEINKDFYWRYKMKENIIELFTSCRQHGNSLDDFHF